MHVHVVHATGCLMSIKPTQLATASADFDHTFMNHCGPQPAKPSSSLRWLCEYMILQEIGILANIMCMYWMAFFTLQPICIALRKDSDHLHEQGHTELMENRIADCSSESILGIVREDLRLRSRPMRDWRLSPVRGPVPHVPAAYRETVWIDAWSHTDIKWLYKFSSAINICAPLFDRRRCSKV